MPYIVLTRRGAEQLLVKLDTETVLVGRGRQCDMLVPDRAIARHQAAILFDGERYRLEDRSGKKTLLNGKPVESEWLADRDYFDLGAYRAHFHDAVLADDEPDRSRIQTLADSRSKPATLPDEVWLTARPLFGGAAIQAALRKKVEIGLDKSNELQLRDDPLVSGQHARVARIDNRLFLHDLGSTNGTWARGLSIKEMELPLGERFQVGGYGCHVSATKEAGEDVAWSFEGIIGRHPLMLQLFDRILAVAPSKASVLISGETGTGKDLVARAIHRRSDRPEGPFIPINCSAISAHLLESQLFGSKKGAYTGAEEDSPGLLADAHGGTFFLDEIGEMPLELQAKILRTVEQGEILRVGASKPDYVDVRFIAGTHRDLPAMVRVGRFREDLLYRLNVLKVDVPPLRRRLEDLPFLVEHFVKEHARRPMRPTPSAEVMKRLLGHRWPGNVRELKNIIQAAFCLMTSSELLPEHIVFDASAAPLPPPAESFLTDALSLEQIEILGLRAALQRHAGNRTKAADELKISRSTLKRKIAEHGLEREGLGDAEDGDEGEE